MVLVLASQEHHRSGQRFGPGSQLFCGELSCCNPRLFDGFVRASLCEALSLLGVLAGCGFCGLA